MGFCTLSLPGDPRGSPAKLGTDTEGRAFGEVLREDPCDRHGKAGLSRGVPGAPFLIGKLPGPHVIEI